jgi:hypothetical protein
LSWKPEGISAESMQHVAAWLTIPVAARSKAQVFGRLVAGVAGSNHAKGMDVCLLCLYVVVLCRYRPLPRVDHSSRGVLPCVYKCVIKKTSREEVKARFEVYSHWMDG